MPITQPIDEDELEADLAALEQENLDEKMLKTGTIPQDQLQRLPQGVTGERESSSSFALLPSYPPGAGPILRRRVWIAQDMMLTVGGSERQIKSAGPRRRRGRGAAEIAGRDGDVR